MLGGPLLNGFLAERHLETESLIEFRSDWLSYLSSANLLGNAQNHPSDPAKVRVSGR